MKNIKYIEFLRKYSFYIGVGCLTIILVIIFREKKFNVFFEEGKQSLASFYTQNLKPLIYTNEITNEDVFNFAMFNSLPVNKKENKLLLIAQDGEGNNSISIHTSEYKEDTGNYQKFIKYLELGDNEKRQFDSLLSFYKARIYSTILSDDKNTIAVNQKIPLMHSLLYADILNFANRTNYSKAKQIYAEKKDLLNPLEIKKIDAMFKDTGPQDYLLLNNDSLYAVSMSIDMPTVKGNPDEWRKEMNKTRVWTNENQIRNIEKNKELFTQYALSRNNKELKVSVPVPVIPNLKDLEKELVKLKNLPRFSKLVTFETDSKDGKNGPLAFKINFDLSKVDSLVSTTMDAVLMMVPKEDREKVRHEMDSAFAKEKVYEKIKSASEKAQLRTSSKDKKNKLKNSDTSGKSN